MLHVTELLSRLRAAGVSQVADDTTTAAAYSSDASLYRIPPQGVAFPRTSEEVVAAFHVAGELGVPVTARGAGTSVAGNAVGAGLVLDLSRHLNRVLEIDPAAGLAVVQPGCVQATLQDAAAQHGLRFGPDPSTSTRCTIGGMVGNNACGSRTLGYGRTVDNVERLKGVFGTGTMFDLTAVQPGARGKRPVDVEGRALHDLVAQNLETMRTSFGRFGRQVSGYSMEHLLPERGFDLARFLVGTEGTLGLITEATVRLVRDPAYRVMVALGYADIASAGDAAPMILRHRPTACEGLDARLVDVVRERRGADAVPVLPSGAAWLFVELTGGAAGEVAERAQALAADSGAGALQTRIVSDPGEAAALWRIRADGAGLAGRSPAGRPAHAGWEDAAVPPESLGSYLRDFDLLLNEFGLTASPFGHFGDGCMHVRLDLPMDRPDGSQVLRAFMIDAAKLVSRYGGSLSGEHGDGRARSELLPLMYPAEALRLFGEVKRICDPRDLLNPGVLVDPAPLDADLRFPAPPVPPRQLAFSWTKDGGDLSQAVHRCTGVGKCRADNTATGGVMCPSYLATGEEKNSTRGRARVLQEMINGTLVQGGWRAPEVHEALDLCLSCKGCASDCPTGTDMAAYKSEVLHQSYRGRIRPRSHYVLGRLPRWARLAGQLPRFANVVLRVGDRIPLLKKAAGVDPRRSLPQFAPVSFRQWAARNGVRPFDPDAIHGRQVLLMVDTFTDHFSPEVGQATVSVLRDAGYEPVTTPEAACCGLTWISTGQLDAAQRILAATVAQLIAPAAAGLPIVGMEPSCTAVLRHELTELVTGPEATAVSRRVLTVAELLSGTPGWEPPDLTGRRVVAQPHCHHHAVMGWSKDAELLRRAGAEVTRLGGCCGLAGNFGVELGHYDVSVKVAEHDLLPAVRSMGADDTILADGFSCRTQLADLTQRRGIHLAQLLEAAE
ncbi:FAD-binding and (Fe-S)-binding domain-containing protein [Leekyejoonella antrihumi]|uniref:FAD-binding protein n=1 Tax=Leekyejoonella antrihumi TaxID=1660198 RepID=A0A563E2B4_9MICO|nr:FAD-binding and (Fe-S)-binding domain-containing protein [Leekyejoonella antrihumi]TWP36044.1 FAD-binding protein [Leekyejoonella antrihumi]